MTMLNIKPDYGHVIFRDYSVIIEEYLLIDYK